MKRLALALLLSVLSANVLALPAKAQSPVTVTGPITPGNCAAFNSNTVIKDGGPCIGGGTLGTMAFQNANSVAITGGTITGLGLPIVSGDAANKQYVDNSIVGLIVHSQALLATIAALPANTYNNGSSGVGATLTGNSNGALTVDGVLTTSSNRIVVKNETAPANNGIYTVTTVGDGSHPYVLTRATDANTPGTSNPAEIGFGTYVFVISGTANSDTGWSVTSIVTTIGTSAINWAQFSVGGGAAGNPGGSSGQVQFNNSGAFGGLTNTQVTALVNSFSPSLSGAAPASGGGTTNFLRADGTWDAPIACCTGYQSSGITGVTGSAGTVSSQGLLNNSISLYNTASTPGNEGTFSSYVDYSSISPNPVSPGFLASNVTVGVKSGTGAPNAYITPLLTSVDDFSGDNNETVSLFVNTKKNTGTGTGTTFGIGLQTFDETTGTISRLTVGMEIDLFGSGSRQNQNNGETLFCLALNTPHFCGQGMIITTDTNSTFDWGYPVKGNISPSGAAFDASTANLQSNIGMMLAPTQRIEHSQHPV